MQAEEIMDQFDGRESKDLKDIIKAHSKMSKFRNIESPECSLIDTHIDEGMLSIFVGISSGIGCLVSSVLGADWIYCVALFLGMGMGMANARYAYITENVSPSMFARLRIFLTRKSDNPKSAYRRVAQYNKAMNEFQEALKEREKAYTKSLRKVQPILDKLNNESFDRYFYFNVHGVISEPREELQGVSDAIGVLKQSQGKKQIEASTQNL